MNSSELEKAVKKAWCRETSSDPDNWSEDNPAWGQCAVTALLVNDFLGGEIVWASVKLGPKRISHYFNKIEGVEKDFTRDQFPRGTYIPPGKARIPRRNTRYYVLSHKDTVERYELLKSRLS